MKLPKLCRQKGRELAYLEIEGRRFYCGKWGTQETQEKYQRIITEWLITKQVVSAAPKDVITVRALVAAFLDHVET